MHVNRLLLRKQEPVLSTRHSRRSMTQLFTILLITGPPQSILPRLQSHQTLKPDSQQPPNPSSHHIERAVQGSALLLPSGPASLA